MCTANSCRSQMAEAWAGRLFPAGWTANSCGLVTYPIVEETRRAMAEVGLDMIGQTPQSLDEYDLDSFDLLVTLSSESNRYLPVLRDPGRHLAIPVEDPMSAKGTDDEIRKAFLAGRDRIRQIVQDIASGRLPTGSNS